MSVAEYCVDGIGFLSRLSVGLVACVPCDLWEDEQLLSSDTKIIIHAAILVVVVLPIFFVRSLFLSLTKRTHCKKKKTLCVSLTPMPDGHGDLGGDAASPASSALASTAPGGSFHVFSFGLATLT